MRLTSTSILYNGFTIPVKIGNHISSDSSVLKFACPHCEDGGEMSQKYICTNCGPEKQFTSGELRKKFDMGDEVKVFDREQVRNLNGESIIEIIGVVARDVIDIRKIIGSFCVYPDIPKKKNVKGKTAKPWLVLKQALAQTGKAVVVRFTNNGKERLGYLVNFDDNLELICTAFEDKFQEPDTELPAIEVTDAEVKNGVDLIEKLEAPNIEEIVDERETRLTELIEKGEPTEKVEEAAEEMAFFK